MAAHVERLAERHGLDVGSHSSGGRAWRRTRRVAYRPVKSTITYAVALHEIGHVVGRGRSAPRLEREANAWAWALRNTLSGTVDATFRAEVMRSLDSYHRWAERRRDRAVTSFVERGEVRRGDPGWIASALLGCPSLPPDDHQFWHLLRTGALPERNQPCETR